MKFLYNPFKVTDKIVIPAGTPYQKTLVPLSEMLYTERKRTITVYRTEQARISFVHPTKKETISQQTEKTATGYVHVEAQIVEHTKTITGPVVVSNIANNLWSYFITEETVTLNNITPSYKKLDLR